ncbi:HlyD family type I secretion periplasmic adaptor subunit [Azospirillum sp. ST 5-10]|uniref:HlyD family type I secretion periplasmic adaptor subunit n=1 Tax=unclassified Azospirillum TaxID=2630922 RepID=UPI003F4A0A9D
MTTLLSQAGPAEVTEEEEAGVPSLAGTVRAAAVVVVLGFGSFFGWAFTATLDSAAVANGVVMVESHRKTVQHLEGGILRELLVREGDEVRAGQVLLRLDATQPSGQLSQVEAQYWAALARAARARAESLDEAEPAFPPALLAARGRPEAAEAITTQTRLFESRGELLRGQIFVQERMIAQTTEVIAALRFQLSATREALKLIDEELTVVREMVEKGYERKPRLLALMRDLANNKAREGELVANVAKAQQEIAQTEKQIAELKFARRSDATRELQEAQTEASTLAEQMLLYKDVLARREVVAPQDGRVVGLKFFTPGGVIRAGEPIMDIVPRDDDLVVEARINPVDIDAVHVGLESHVRLTAYRQRRVPAIGGEVVHVSADAMTDEATGVSYFAARVRLSAEELRQLPDVHLAPGMPAEVAIVTGGRRAIDYFLGPWYDATYRAFREE